MTTNTDRTREKLTAIGEELTKRHLGDEMREISLGGILLMLSKGHMLIYGLHGANKSRIIEDMFGRITGSSDFTLHGSAYASVEDLVGPIKMSGLDKDEYVRALELKLPEAHFGYLDEVCECNDALVKVLHPLMNERHYANGGPPKPVPLMCLFGATNVEIEDAIDGKAAFIDRFHLRFKVSYPDDPHIVKQILRMSRGVTDDGKRAAKEKHTTITLKELKDAQAEVSKVEVPETIDDTFCKIYKLLTGKGVEISPRRMVQMVPIFQASAWFRGHEVVDVSDLNILRHSLWTQEEHIPLLCKILAVEAKSHVSQATELLDSIKRLHTKFKGLLQGDSQHTKIISQVQEKSQKLTTLSEEYTSQGKDPREIDRAYEEANRIHYKMLKGDKSDG